MAHYAFLDENNIVTEVISGIDETELIEGLDPETWYGNFRGQRCVRTSYNGKIRKRYAGIGYKYDDAFDAFIPPKPYDSWIFDEENLSWKPPVKSPDQGLFEWHPDFGWVEILTLGRPKSGNHFLIYAISALTGKPKTSARHNPSEIVEKVNQVAVPFRHPGDAILSANPDATNEDVEIWIDLHEQVLTHRDKIIVFDFNRFTNDVAYIAKKLGMTSSKEVTIQSIKQSMIDDNAQIHLPGDTPKTYNHQLLANLPSYNKALELYDEMKAWDASQS